MNYVALDPHAGTPVPGDLAWSALPGAPVERPRTHGWWTRIINRVVH